MLDINSVLIYLGCFLSATLFCQAASMSYRKDKKKIGNVCSIFTIFILCMVAACRDTSVGGDISVYVLPNYNLAINSNFKDFLLIASQQIEILFAILVYICAKLKNIEMLFFLIEFLCITPIYVVLYRNRNRLSMPVGLQLYLLLFYNFSLSGMRQGIAMSLLVLAFDNWVNNKRKTSVLICIIASLFHTSAAIIYLITIKVLRTVKKQKFFKIICELLAIFSFVFVFYNAMALRIANIIWNISPRYSFYIRKYISSNINWQDIPITDLMIKTFLVIVAISLVIKNKEKDCYIITLVILSILGRCFVLLNARFFESMRLAYYFDIYDIYLVACSVKCFKKRSNIRLYSWGIIFFAFLYWLYFIMIIGGYSTNVYVLYGA